MDLEFIEIITEIGEKLDLIKKYMVEDHMNMSPEDINYGTIGTANYINSQLNEIIIHLRMGE